MSNWKNVLQDELNKYEFKYVLPGTKEIVKYKPLTTKDIKYLLIHENSNSMEAMEEVFDIILNNVLIDKVDIDEMYISDRYALIFELRKNSKGSIINLPIFTCPKCKSQSMDSFNLNGVDIKSLKDDIDNKIKIADSISIELDFIKRKHMKEIFAYQNKIKYKSNVEKAGDLVVISHAQYIDKIFENDNEVKDITLKDKIEFINLLPEHLFNKIADWISDNSFGLSELTHKKVCQHCGHTTQESIGINDLF